ncbi:DUF4388 domain-containing protein [Actinoplanes friuliensis]|jgi:hypothetical protein|uniref:PatA-like N-terminal domain-containing protein n=1 Tax=Actinoplanes friuliensis DSM 7358 TaxID=1246995 RepID=U5VSS7_9ACTN|nr:DUF4388 domain-containing protein [Actinoplanes friuliensis]AGZ39919.1 hypothetical protein AFR_08150 [Actinoplanes friuliensis DSM 7358]
MNSLRRLLSNLAESGRTGALHIDGTPGGVVYLVAGRITHAESPDCPGIGERLVACGRLSEGAWLSAYRRGVGDRAVGRMLVRDGHLGHHELACRVVATITAATHALLQSGDAPARFVPGERHWFGTVAQVELGGLGHETAKRLLNRPAAHRPRATSRPRKLAATPG